jgi:hypothetical protein
MAWEIISYKDKNEGKQNYGWKHFFEMPAEDINEDIQLDFKERNSYVRNAIG